MAKASTPYQLHGKIGSLFFRVRDGKQFVHMAPSQYKVTKAGPAHGLNRREFAGAAKIANDIYRNIKPARNSGIGPIFAPYPQNILTAKLKQGADIHRKLRQRHFYYADAFRFHDTARALKGLDLGHADAPTAQVRMIPVGPLHNPTGIKVLGLEQAAATISSHGNARIECRFQITQSRVRELAFDHANGEWLPTQETTNERQHRTQPTDWIPVDIIPQQGITLPLPADWAEGTKYLSTVTIEWREVRTVGRRIVHHHKKAIVRIACLHANAEAFAPQDSRSLSHSHSKHTHQTIPRSRPPLHWRTDPIGFLNAALQKLRI